MSNSYNLIDRKEKKEKLTWEEKSKKKAIKVMDKFLLKRLETLNSPGMIEGAIYFAELQEKIEKSYKASRAIDCPDWVAAYHKIGDALRRNKYKTYTQMYQRNTDRDTGITVLKDDDLNPAATRGIIDDQLTKDPEWRKGSKREIYEAMTFSGHALPEDASSNMGAFAKAYDRKHNFEKSDKHTTMELRDDPTKDHTKMYDNWYEAVTTNRRFNPHSKQVFAALNYGKRPHGSTTGYGYSYLKLKPELKQKCLYFPGDTFYFMPKTRFKSDAQITYDWLGHIMAHAETLLAQQIFEGCHEGTALADTGSPDALLEAHIFQDIQLNRDVEALCLSRYKLSDKEFEDVLENALEWSNDNHIRLHHIP